MLVVYSSKTGNVKRFVNKLGEGIKCLNIKDIDSKVNEPYVLITYTTGFGEVPNEVDEFLNSNHENLVAVCASGNRNWGKLFGASGDKISKKYNVPLLIKFELSGTKKDVELFLQKIKELKER
jgi:protein involved in ribonucleotide reduction